jgi:hypothetical protein
MTRWTSKRRVRLRGSGHVPDAIVAEAKWDSLCLWDMQRVGMRRGSEGARGRRGEGMRNTAHDVSFSHSSYAFLLIAHCRWSRRHITDRIAPLSNAKADERRRQAKLL